MCLSIEAHLYICVVRSCKQLHFGRDNRTCIVKAFTRDCIMTKKCEFHCYQFIVTYSVAIIHRRASYRCMNQKNVYNTLENCNRLK